MRIVLYLFLAILCFAPASFAQARGSNHINVGIYGNFFRVSDTAIDLGGVGARVSVNIMPKIQLEAESAYNFAEFYNSGLSDFDGTLTVSQSHVRTLDGLFGPKVYTNKGPFRIFGTVKGGFMNVNLSTSAPVTIQEFTSQFQPGNGVNTYAVFYPGGGAEAFCGPFGVRVDIGDEILFANGTHNNLRVSFDPTIRF